MRTIGLIGGMSWESSAEYYRLINQQVRDRLGPLRSAQILMYSVDFGPVEQAAQLPVTIAQGDRQHRIGLVFGRQPAWLCSRQQVVATDDLLRDVVFHKPQRAYRHVALLGQR